MKFKFSVIFIYKKMNIPEHLNIIKLIQQKSYIESFLVYNINISIIESIIKILKKNYENYDQDCLYICDDKNNKIDMKSKIHDIKSDYLTMCVDHKKLKYNNLMKIINEDENIYIVSVKHEDKCYIQEMTLNFTKEDLYFLLEYKYQINLDECKLFFDNIKNDNYITTENIGSKKDFILIETAKIKNYEKYKITINNKYELAVSDNLYIYQLKIIFWNIYQKNIYDKILKINNITLPNYKTLKELSITENINIEIEQDIDETHFDIKISALNGNNTFIKASTNTKVSDIYEYISEKQGIPIEQLRIIYEGKQLEIGKDLDYYKIHSGCSMKLVIRLCGGMYNQTSGRNGYEKLNNCFIFVDCEEKDILKN